jgi:putative transposase
MPEQKTPLEPGNYYHACSELAEPIYNRGINGCVIFKDPTNYEYFLGLYEKHISPVAETYAWCLMGNHFHLLVRIKEEDFFSTSPDPDLEGSQNLRGLDVPLKKNLPYEKRINQQFSNQFNAYTKAFNKKHHRTGSLFEHSFRRKQINDEDYLKNVIIYIHNNPIHHGFCQNALEYPWSSYFACISENSTNIIYNTVINWFGDNENFIQMHNQLPESNISDDWLEL